MNRFIEASDDGNAIFINADKIVYIRINEDKCTEILFDNGKRIEITDDIYELMKIIEQSGDAVYEYEDALSYRS